MSHGDRPQQNQKRLSDPPPTPQWQPRKSPPPIPSRAPETAPLSIINPATAQISAAKRRRQRRRFAVCLVCSVLMAAGIARFWGGFEPKVTTAADYTSAEVAEIVRILKEDDETRHGLLVPDSWEHHEQISVDLWEAVLGKPTAMVREDRDSAQWHYKTKDGTVVVSVVVYPQGHVNAEHVGLPFMHASNVQFSVGLGAKTIDSAALKKRIMAIREQVHSRLPPDPYVGKSAEEIRAIVRTEFDAQQEKLAREKEEADARFWGEFQAAQRAKDIAARIPLKAETEFHNDLMSFFDLRSPEREQLEKQAQDWVNRRSAALREAHEKGEDWLNLPLPSKTQVANALRAGQALPVIASAPAALSNGMGTPILDSITTATRSPSGAKVNQSVQEGRPQLPHIGPVFRIKTPWTRFYRGGEATIESVVKAQPTWKLEGIVCYGFQEEVEGTVPLFRYYRRDDGRHTYLVSDQPAEKGFRREGEGGRPMIWIWPTQQEGTVPLHRLRQPRRGWRILAVGLYERDELVASGEWIDEGRLGFVYRVGS